ncbi:cytochrome c oxidase subunit 5A, mitochondrial-like protein [Euroglyphus maynei]|uniref:Cytochrome c oxidase subunit 5A, mitochondrial n=1 Tax=Euroglyphus maynei TaxID=6958 RepID=A0A1Y3BQ09_EURMA|nr:cytochrome c oxidase subunit 5A, mitochondrial-like protein [Euroglyphus maynei]
MLIKTISSNLRSVISSRCGQLSQLRALSSQVENMGLAEPKHGRKETDEQFDQRYIQYFSRPEIDNWELRKGINDLHGMDLVPEPAIIIAALEAARRLNDHSICVRFLEALRWKSRFDKNIYPYLIQEIRPTLDKLGISTPEELGYHEPELTIDDCFDK